MSPPSLCRCRTRSRPPRRVRRPPSVSMWHGGGVFALLGRFQRKVGHQTGHQMVMACVSGQPIMSLSLSLSLSLARSLSLCLSLSTHRDRRPKPALPGTRRPSRALPRHARPPRAPPPPLGRCPPPTAPGSDREPATAPLVRLNGDRGCVWPAGRTQVTSTNVQHRSSETPPPRPRLSAPASVPSERAHTCARIEVGFGISVLAQRVENAPRAPCYRHRRGRGRWHAASGQPRGSSPQSGLKVASFPCRCRHPPQRHSPPCRPSPAAFGIPNEPIRTSMQCQTPAVETISAHNVPT